MSNRGDTQRAKDPFIVILLTISHE